ncbi:D-amino acid dehydrogenase [Herminiimonas fonticola]|uniref:D-amino-acid dehydrogenase n=1 Tax=Herminiimonas fonticola TaxID=303380 RepID=A0A4R6G390_9BURK|nr:D-amino acid dehydrogenase [Herminiimonas fonticola]RBA23455.1 Glycine/D-amino acid oxidases (deaminating) [Herminiimonas fonticola]TDN88290.1 D-amino-acid dehydrogenase [Herminiimonas fonticola]
MQVAVVGAGVIGVCTAYFLAEAGHEVVVIERRNNVAEEASFGDPGILAPSSIAPWSAPGVPKSFFSYLLKAESPLFFNRVLDPSLWRWMRRWMKESDIARYQINRERMQRIAFYSSDVMQQLRDRHQLDYEQASGYLQLFRSERDLKLAKSGFDFLAANGIRHDLPDADALRLIEPALNTNIPLAGSLHLPADESGNCPLFTRQIRQLAQAMGVEFHFGCNVKSIRQIARGVDIRIDDYSFSADKIVLASGADSAKLLAPMGLHLPVYPVKSYSATATIRNFESAPISSVVDEAYKVAITRMGNRIRIAGTAELGSRTPELRQAALNTLMKIGYDWFPDASNYNTASFWSGTSLMMPDGPPLLGATSVRNVYVNIGHGSTGWAMAAGSGKVLADIVSDRVTDIDLDGLTAMRFS